MLSTNQILLIGYIGNHLVSHNTQTGKRRVCLRVATNEWRSSKGGNKVPVTTWHDVVAWEARARFAESCLVKGSRVMIRGSMEYRTYEDKMGHTRYVAQINAKEITNLDR